jgi:hypothetical protein
VDARVDFHSHFIHLYLSLSGRYPGADKGKPALEGLPVLAYGLLEAGQCAGQEPGDVHL